MIKFIYYLIICSTLLFHSCGERNTMPKGPEENNSNNKKEDTDVNTALTADEEQKFNTLKIGFDTLITNLQNQLTIDPSLDISTKNKYQDMIKKYPSFIDWLENNIQKKKELANAFTYFYDFLNEQRIKQSSNFTTEQLLINTINCNFTAYQRNNTQCNNNSYAYNDKLNKTFKFTIAIVFSLLLTEISHKNINEEILEAMIQDILLKPDPSIANLIGTDRLEAMIRKEKLNDSQKQGLDFLKEAFINFIHKDHMLYTFLLSKEDKIKEVLDHINNELEKCSGDDEKKGTFKNAIKNYFNIISTQKLNEFKDQVKSGC